MQFLLWHRSGEIRLRPYVPTWLIVTVSMGKIWTWILLVWQTWLLLFYYFVWYSAFVECTSILILWKTYDVMLNRSVSSVILNNEQNKTLLRPIWGYWNKWLLASSVGQEAVDQTCLLVKWTTLAGTRPYRVLQLSTILIGRSCASF